jgi:hypothetical protein
MLASALTAACEQAKIDAAEWNDGDVIPWDGWTDAIARILAKAGLATVSAKVNLRRVIHSLSV